MIMSSIFKSVVSLNRLRIYDMAILSELHAYFSPMQLRFPGNKKNSFQWASMKTKQIIAKKVRVPALNGM